MEGGWSAKLANDVRGWVIIDALRISAFVREVLKLQLECNFTKFQPIPYFNEITHLCPTIEKQLCVLSLLSSLSVSAWRERQLLLCVRTSAQRHRDLEGAGELIQAAARRERSRSEISATRSVQQLVIKLELV